MIILLIISIIISGTLIYLVITTLKDIANTNILDNLEKILFNILGFILLSCIIFLEIFFIRFLCL